MRKCPKYRPYRNFIFGFLVIPTSIVLFVLVVGSLYAFIQWDTSAFWRVPTYLVPETGEGVRMMFLLSVALGIFLAFAPND